MMTALALILSGCGGEGGFDMSALGGDWIIDRTQSVSPQPARAPAAFESTLDASCYTVDLFTPPNWVRPDESVPEAWRGFAGRWGGGAWAGEWCHDLYVVEIQPDGLVRLIETHAPYEAWGKPATAFRRTARIGRDGRMRLAYGDVTIEYWLRDGRLLGMRREGSERHRIMMSRRDA